MKKRRFALFLSLSIGLACSAEKHLTGGRVEEVECIDRVTKLAQSISKLQKVETPWKGVPTAGLRLGFREEGATYALGFSTKELIESGILFHACKRAPEAVLVVHPEHFPSAESGVGIAFPEGWNDRVEFVKKNGNALATKIAVPFIVMDLSKFPARDVEPYGKIFENPDALANVAAHETFHLYQYKQFENRTYGGMRHYELDPKWVEAFRAEVADWESIGKAIGGKDEEQIKEIARGMLHRRKAGLPETLSNWENVAQFERMEGLAHYYATESARRAELKDGADVTFLYTKGNFSADNPEIYNRGRAFFYVTGAKMAEVLQALDPAGEWQREIEAGKTPVEVLEGVLRK